MMALLPDEDPAQFAALTTLFQHGRFQALLDQSALWTGRHPRSSFLQFLLGSAHARLNQPDAAIACFEKAIAIRPDHAEAHHNLGILFAMLGRDDDAVAALGKVITLSPTHADAHSNLGIVFARLGRMDEAMSVLRKAVRLKPDHAVAWFNLGNLLKDRGQNDEAIAAYRHAIARQPGYVPAYNNLGRLLYGLGRNEDAVQLLSRAVSLKPDFADAHNNLGVAQGKLNRRDEAAAHFRRAIAVQPHYAEAHYNLGALLANLGQPDEAIACFDRALSLKPAYARARAQKLHQMAVICDWDGLAADAPAVTALGITGEAVPPYLLLALDDDPARQLIRARNFAEQYLPSARPAPHPGRATRPGELSVGYFSADFHDHATMHLMARLFELHDRSRFRIHAFSYGPETGDVMQVRVKSAVDAFHDVRHLGDEEIAALARQQGIDIAVDLKGDTKDSRVALFAHRPAPVQISYLGYPGTMGATFLDYLVADPVVIPQEQRAHYSESLIVLPGSYQANDDSRIIADETPTRAQLGLPDGFVFCCFNNSFKIGAEEFGIWMRLLDQVEGSVLWLLKSGAERNLRREAEKRGVNPARLVFAERTSPAQHLARHRQADLFLDSFRYNAHTTASDALWAGLPLVTMPGKSFAARVAASLLNAVNLPELIAETPEAYERLALSLATNPVRLAALKRKLAAARHTTPLFQSARFTRQLESAFDQAYARALKDAPPADIAVAES
ncbi:MAG TPA: tetratricopeptide repeat protein [Rhizomicrobium sp.]|jgi:predicted O-linked N-acetylglucosamine transferase (SPINDLY family)|nr:tetratricopeptide repeat protein [Rhizomicrobium sp.]